MGTVTGKVGQVTTDFDETIIIAGSSTFWDLGCKGSGCSVLGSRLGRNRCSKVSNNERIGEMHFLIEDRDAREIQGKNFGEIRSDG